MLVGMLINIAVFPFSGWMVKYYPKASPSGFLYLISFTTKISVILLAKIFLGLEEMKYIAVIMILYSSFKATMEENVFSILCYLSIMAMGIMLLGISVGTKEAILATTCYLFIHIMYKLLLSISAAILADEANINFCQDIKKINNKILLFGIVLGILMMLNIPLSSSFVIKSALSHLFSDSLIYMLIIFSSFMMAFALPWKKYFSTTKSLDIKLNIYSKVSIIFMVFVLIIIAIFGMHIPVLKEISQFNNLMIFSSDTLKQIIVILSGLLAASLYMTHRKDTKPINFIEWLGDVFFGLYPRWVSTKVQKNEVAESWEIKNLEKQILNKLSTVHNQKNAIFIVFTVFIVMLLVLITSI
jgi:multicomponent Na+:H+ antiporter subunit D